MNGFSFYVVIMLKCHYELIQIVLEENNGLVAKYSAFELEKMVLRKYIYVIFKLGGDNMTVDVDKRIVQNFLGYGKKKMPKIIEKKIDQELEKYQDYLEPEFHMIKTSVDLNRQDIVVFDGRVTIESSYLYKKLSGMESAYVVIYTVGEEIERVIDNYSNNADMMRAMIVDKIGVVALDSLRDRLVHIIEEKEAPLSVSSVSYPAQGDFSIESQKSLYGLFKDDVGTIVVNEFSQFSPIKTVLLVYGIGEGKDNSNMCDQCENPCSTPKYSEN